MGPLKCMLFTKKLLFLGEKIRESRSSMLAYFNTKLEKRETAVVVANVKKFLLHLLNDLFLYQKLS